MDALQFAAGNLQVARLLGAAGEEHSVKFSAQTFHGDIYADVRIRLKIDSFGAHLLHAPVDQVLLHFEIGDTVAQQPADPVRFLEYRDVMPGPRQLLRGGQSCGARTHDCHALARPKFRRFRLDVTLFEGPVDDGFLNLLDRYWRFVDPQNTRGFTRRRADASCKLGEVVGRVQLAHSLFPAAS